MHAHKKTLNWIIKLKKLYLSLSTLDCNHAFAGLSLRAEAGNWISVTREDNAGARRSTEWINQWGSSSETVGTGVHWASPLLQFGSLLLPQFQTDPKILCQGNRHNYMKISEHTEVRHQLHGPSALSDWPSTSILLTWMSLSPGTLQGGTPSSSSLPLYIPELGCLPHLFLNPPTAFSGTHPNCLYP